MNCQARISPYCTGLGIHWHHRKLRSQGGSDNPVNLLKVCGPCHDWIHNNVAESYSLGLLIRSWQSEDTPVVLGGQAPTAVVSEPLARSPGEDGVLGEGDSADRASSTREAQSPSPSIPEDTCPKCKGTGHVPKPEPYAGQPERKKVTWVVRVPKDAQEDGYEILDTLILECSTVLGFSGTRGARYYTLSRCLAWFLQTYDPEQEEA